MRSLHRRQLASLAGIGIILGWLFINPQTTIGVVHAATASSAVLSISPATGSYAPGQTFTASVMLDSGGGVGVNAADGHLTFDPTLLAVQSISKDNSVFNLWTSNPTFSNTAGTIDYSGGSNNTYTGSAGDVVDITFQALAAGTAALNFASATALAADGQGTNVLKSSTGATYTLSGSAAPSAPPVTPPQNTASTQQTAASDASAESEQAPYTPTVTIASPTHPNSAQWYNNNAPNFTWTLTPDIAGVSVAFDQNPATNPKRSSVGLISSEQYSNIAEGTWYFHARFEDAVGDWSAPINFQVNIDVTPPLPFTVTAVPGAGISGRTELMFNATDSVSGMDHYVTVFDNGATTTVALSDVQNGIYTAPPLLPGDHTVEVSAFDKAGNVTNETASFSISGIAMPEITNYPTTVVDKSPIVLEGTADSGSNVVVDIDDASGKTVAEGKLIADETGHWLYAVEGGLPANKYSLAVSMITTQGALASSTDKLFINVTSAPFLDRFGWILIALLLIGIAGLLAFGYYKKKILSMQLGIAKRENEEARERTKVVFEALREEVDEKISHMEGGAAQAQGEAKLEPENVLDAVRNALSISETTIQKEIDDVDKALNEE
jgi:hypothetical protein